MARASSRHVDWSLTERRDISSTLFSFNPMFAYYLIETIDGNVTQSLRFGVS